MGFRHFQARITRRVAHSWSIAAVIALTATVVPFAAASAAGAPPVTNPGSTSILTTWPPLEGGTSYTATFAEGKQTNAWYSLYKIPGGTPATIAIPDSDNSGCATLGAELLDSNGAADPSVATATLSGSDTATLNVPASQPGDPRGLYYLELWG